MKTARKLLVNLLLFAMFASLIGCNSRPFIDIGLFSEPAPYTSPDLAKSQQLTFENVWTDINENYLREDFGGANWVAINQEYAEKLSPSLSQTEFHELLLEMVAEIPDSGIELVTRQERINQATNNNLGFSGLGPFIAVRDGADEERRLIVLHVIPGSAAAVAGLRPHDAILSIDGEQVKVDEGEHIFQSLQGADGSDAQLLVRSPQQEPRFVTMTRRPTRSEAIPLHSFTVPQTNIIYVEFPPHEGRSILGEFSAVLDNIQQLDRENRGLIIDMRLMTGIQRTAIFQLLPLFVDGDIAEQNNRGEINPIEIKGISSPLQDFSKVAIALIVGPETAGAAELFAAALQDQERAIVIGQTTSGSLEEFEDRFLSNGSQLTMPISTIITTNSQRDIGQLGVEPNIPVATSWDEITPENDPVFDQAVQSILIALEANGSSDR